MNLLKNSVVASYDKSEMNTDGIVEAVDEAPAHPVYFCGYAPAQD